MIVLENISKIFNRGEENEVTALKNISVTINDGEFVVMIGANGSGKTTLLNVLSGSEKVSSGKISIDEINVTQLAEYKRSKWIARVFQNPFNGTASELSILDNFRLAALRTQRKKLTIGITGSFKKRVQDMIARLDMGLENKVNQMMGNLSGGQRQALTLLMSVMDEARILLLDEPTAALDPKSAAMVLSLADQLIREYHLTALFITHNLRDAQRMGSRLIQFRDGEIARQLNAEEKSKIQLQDMASWFGGM